jgi:hypothetical protein
LFIVGNKNEEAMGNIRTTAVMLLFVLLGQTLNVVAPSGNDKKAKIKNQLVIIPIRTNIEVKLLKKGSGKIAGKLKSTSNESFVIRRNGVSSPLDERIAFADVKSVKKGSTDLKSVKNGQEAKKTLITVGRVIAGVVAIAILVTAQIWQNRPCPR